MLAMDTRWRVAIALMHITAVLSSGGRDPSETCPGEQLGSEGAGVASDEHLDISSVSHTGKPNQVRRSSGRLDPTRRKRSRRTGFSVEDVSADEYFHPLWALFRDSLSGREGHEQVNSVEPGVLSGPRSSADPFTGIPTTPREKSDEVGTKRSTTWRTHTINSA